jgi:hypothetical protein
LAGYNPRRLCPCGVGRLQPTDLSWVCGPQRVCGEMDDEMDDEMDSHDHHNHSNVEVNLWLC